jgi:Cu2+-exporting ATPase
MTSVAACPGCAAAPLAMKHAESHVAPALVLSLPTIHCAACIGKVERKLNAMPEVDNARVNLSLKQLSVHGKDIDMDTVVTTLKSIGYDAYPLDVTLLETRQDSIGRNLLVRLAVAGFAMMNVMLFSVAVWSGASDTTRDLFHLISATISVPAVLYCGQPFFASAWSALRVRGLNMDVPISLAILLATGMSLFEVMNGGAHAYFDAALSLTFFLLIGRYLDHHTRSSVRSAAKELSALEVHVAQRIEDRKAVKTAVSNLVVGDRILIPSGVRVPVDGTLDSPKALSDRSFLTGESAAIALAQGQQVQAGEINLGGPFEMTATAVGDDTTLRRVASLVEMAENSRNSYTNLADRAAQIYAPAVHLLAFVSFVAWVWIDGDIRHAINIAVAVLIITCPCALGLAVPAVATAAIGRLYSIGFLVKSGTALERLAEVDVAIFDKTGTLTLAGDNARLEHLSPEQAAIARGLAQASDHPVSRALVAALPNADVAQLAAITEIAGSGMQAIYKGQTVKLGRGTWLGASFDGLGLQVGLAPPVPLPLQETPRQGVSIAIKGLQDLGIPPRILSGDKQDAVSALAQELGIKDIQAEVSATGKHEYLTDLQKAGHHVLMIGDGLNDTASLAAAHASVAPSSALDASRNAADVVMLRENLDNFPLLIRIARSTSRLSKQNFAIAAGYNAIAIPVALLGYATPLVAAIAMSASSITVIANAMRVRFVE